MERFPVEGATDVVVHIRQAHEDFDLPPKIIPVIEECQREIHRILLALKKHDTTKLESVYNESTVHGKEGVHLQFYRQLLRKGVTECLSVSNLPFFAKLDPTPREVEKGMKSFQLLQRRVNGLSIMARVGAAEVLALNDEIKLIGMENERVKAITDRAKMDPTLPEFKKRHRMYDAREQAFLYIARSSKRTIHFLILGFGHDMRTKIDEWNEAVAGQDNTTKFSLVVVSPQSVLNHEKELQE